MTPGPTPPIKNGGGQPAVHPASHNPPSSDRAAPGEGWAEGPSRRNAQAPFRRPARSERLRGDGTGAASQRNVRRERRPLPRSPQTVRGWSDKKPKTAEIVRQLPT